VESLRLDLPLLFEAVDHVFVAPTDLVREALQKHNSKLVCSLFLNYPTDLHCAVLPPRLEAQDPQCLWNHHPLLTVVRRRDTLEELEAFESSRTTGGLVRNHTTDRAVENLGGCAVMERARLFGVDNVTLVKEIVVAEL
jgi:hypothetical protein